MDPETAGKKSMEHKNTSVAKLQAYRHTMRQGIRQGILALPLAAQFATTLGNKHYYTHRIPSMTEPMDFLSTINTKFSTEQQQ